MFPGNFQPPPQWSPMLQKFKLGELVNTSTSRGGDKLSFIFSLYFNFVFFITCIEVASNVLFSVFSVFFLLVFDSFAFVANFLFLKTLLEKRKNIFPFIFTLWMFPSTTIYFAEEWSTIISKKHILRKRGIFHWHEVCLVNPTF